MGWGYWHRSPVSGKLWPNSCLKNSERFSLGNSLLPKFKMADSPTLTQRRNEMTNETQNFRYFWCSGKINSLEMPSHSFHSSFVMWSETENTGIVAQMDHADLWFLFSAFFAVLGFWERIHIRDMPDLSIIPCCKSNSHKTLRLSSLACLWKKKWRRKNEKTREYNSKFFNPDFTFQAFWLITLVISWIA